WPTGSGRSCQSPPWHTIASQNPATSKRTLVLLRLSEAPSCRCAVATSHKLLARNMPERGEDDFLRTLRRTSAPYGFGAELGTTLCRSCAARLNSRSRASHNLASI